MVFELIIGNQKNEFDACFSMKKKGDNQRTKLPRKMERRRDWDEEPSARSRARELRFSLVVKLPTGGSGRALEANGGACPRPTATPRPRMGEDEGSGAREGEEVPIEIEL